MSAVARSFLLNANFRIPAYARRFGHVATQSTPGYGPRTGAVKKLSAEHTISLPPVSDSYLMAIRSTPGYGPRGAAKKLCTPGMQTRSTPGYGPRKGATKKLCTPGMQTRSTPGYTTGPKY